MSKQKEKENRNVCIGMSLPFLASAIVIPYYYPENLFASILAFGSSIWFLFFGLYAIFFHLKIVLEKKK